MTMELCDTFAYCSMCRPDVNNGFCRKPSPSLVVEIKDDMGREGIDERQGTRFATDLRIADASDDIHTCCGLGYVRPQWHWAAGRKTCLLE
jgi:hypothetical protein